MMGKLLQSVVRLSGFPITVAVVVLVVVNLMMNPLFLSKSTVSSIFFNYSPLIIATLAQSLVLVGGGIDLSVGGIVSLVNALVIVFLAAGREFLVVARIGNIDVCKSIGECSDGFSLWWAVTLALVIGVLVGGINGVAIGFFRIRPLLATLATLFISSGAALYVLPMPSGQFPANVVAWYQADVVGVPKALITIVIVWLFWLSIMRSRYGVYLCAVGNNEKKAFMSGLAVSWIQFIMYVLSGLLAALAGIINTMVIGTGDATVGLPYTLNSIGAAVLGGISLSGGTGSVFGPVFGAIFLGLIVNTVLNAGVRPWYQGLISGLILVLGLSLAVVLKSRVSHRQQLQLKRKRSTSAVHDWLKG